MIRSIKVRRLGKVGMAVVQVKVNGFPFLGIGA